MLSTFTNIQNADTNNGQVLKSAPKYSLKIVHDFYEKYPNV